MVATVFGLLQMLCVFGKVAKGSAKVTRKGIVATARFTWTSRKGIVATARFTWTWWRLAIPFTPLLMFVLPKIPHALFWSIPYDVMLAITCWLGLGLLAALRPLPARVVVPWADEIMLVRIIEDYVEVGSSIVDRLSR
jgi:hypothetical protein